MTEGRRTAIWRSMDRRKFGEICIQTRMGGLKKASGDSFCICRQGVLSTIQRSSTIIPQLWRSHERWNHLALWRLSCCRHNQSHVTKHSLLSPEAVPIRLETSLTTDASTLRMVSFSTAYYHGPLTKSTGFLDGFYFALANHGIFNTLCRILAWRWLW